MKKTLLYACSLLLTTILSACGGSSSDTALVNQDPQGFWIGTTSSGYDLAAVVLENGDYYSLYSQNDIVVGAYYGKLSVMGNDFTGSLNDIYVPNNQSNSGSIYGSFSPKSTLQGTSEFLDNRVRSFTTTYSTSYDRPATLSAIAGQYVGPIYSSAATADLSISQSGIVSGYTVGSESSLQRCIITGNVVPRASGKNVYDLTMFWNNNPDPNAPRCCLSGSTICATNTPTTGIAIVERNYLYTAWINAAGTSGFLWRGTKAE
jgi:hypothetical protein